jgi:hypothetical protein
VCRWKGMCGHVGASLDSGRVRVRAAASETHLWSLRSDFSIDETEIRYIASSPLAYSCCCLSNPIDRDLIQRSNVKARKTGPQRCDG